MTSTLIRHGEARGRQRRSAQQWREIVDRYGESGLTQSAFCRREDLPLASFSKWLHRLRVAAEPINESNGATFIQLESARPEGNRDAGGYTIRLDLGAGIVLEISRH